MTILTEIPPVRAAPEAENVPFALQAPERPYKPFYPLGGIFTLGSSENRFYPTYSPSHGHCSEGVTLESDFLSRNLRISPSEGIRPPKKYTPQLACANYRVLGKCSRDRQGPDRP